MLPNLVAAVRDVMAYEQAVLEEVTRLRNAYDPDRPVPEQGDLSTETSRAVRSLLAVVEAYPTLRADANVLSLQAEIERLESLIADRRELYNDQVYRYNTRIAQFPGVVLAGLFGWRRRDFFAAGEGTNAARREPAPRLTRGGARRPRPRRPAASLRRRGRVWPGSSSVLGAGGLEVEAHEPLNQSGGGQRPDPEPSAPSRSWDRDLRHAAQTGVSRSACSMALRWVRSTSGLH